MQQQAAGSERWVWRVVFHSHPSSLEGYLDAERIWQHISNIRAINFKGKPVPEGIDTYIDSQIAYIHEMIRLHWDMRVSHRESACRRGAVLEVRGPYDDAAGGLDAGVSDTDGVEPKIQQGGGR